VSLLLVCRRHFLIILLFLAGCAPSATLAPAPKPTQPAGASEPASKPGPQSEWERTLAAAKQEGKVSVVVAPGDTYRNALLGFQKAYPEISLELTGLRNTEWLPRVTAERQAGQYVWDVLVGSTGAPSPTLKAQGVFDPLRPNLLLDEVLDDSKWYGGFDSAYYDVEGQYLFSFQGNLNNLVYVNRDVVPESELARVEDLALPQWKGKIASEDMTVFGPACGVGAHWLLVMNEEFLRQVIQNTEGVTRDPRQLAEWVVRGRYPIWVGIQESTLVTFLREGLGQNVRPLAAGTDAGSRLSVGSGGLMIVNQAPHPNAARVFANWLLSREGQTAWVEETSGASRRLDVTVGAPDKRPDPRRQYAGDIAAERYTELPDRCVEIAKALAR
jgi:ABC-type Fe3+ transport system substrate-binding protein